MEYKVTGRRIEWKGETIPSTEEVQNVRRKEFHEFPDEHLCLRSFVSTGDSLTILEEIPDGSPNPEPYSEEALKGLSRLGRSI